GHAAAGERIAQVTGPDGTPLVAARGADAGTPQDPPPYRLTGHFDPYLLGYADRGLVLPPSLASRIATGGGFLMPCVLRDGMVVGTWRHTWRGAEMALRVEPLTGPPAPDLGEALDAEAADLSRFLAVPVGWEYGAV
ncbi:MAG: hypothetical protein HOY79_30105, partial [Streptomyces sp.]|nr:hypothetical protein [Streptomyces sp.]